MLGIKFVVVYLTSYIFLLITLSQFCESKAVNKKQLRYKLYLLIMAPISIPLKLVGVDFQKWVSNLMYNLNDGRTYFVTGFFYVLWLLSFCMVYHTFIKKYTIIFPQQDDNGDYRWKLFPTDVTIINSIDKYYTFLTFALHISSIISFTVAMLRDPTPQKDKNDEKYDNVYYSDQLECEDCQQKKPARSSHCTNCNECVVKRDHHCVWINRCVGKRNILWFVVFLTTTCFACGLAALISIFTLLKLMVTVPNNKLNVFMLYQNKVINLKQILLWTIQSTPVLTSSILLHALIFVMLLPFSFIHIFQLLLNETTIEKMKKNGLLAIIKNDEFSFYVQEDCKNVGGCKKFLKKNGVNYLLILEIEEGKKDKYEPEKYIEKNGFKYTLRKKEQMKKLIAQYDFYNRGLLQNIKSIIRDSFY